MFLIRTIHVNHIERDFLLVNELFFDKNLKSFPRVLIIKPLSIDGMLTSSGSTQTDILLDGFGNIDRRVRHLIFDWILKNIFQLDVGWVNSIIGFFSWVNKKQKS
jgi:hypothetical protein